jgi:hypothetical protein
MRRRFSSKHRPRTGRSVGYVASIAFAVGAAALLASMMPSARRYLRMRAM